MTEGSGSGERSTPRSGPLPCAAYRELNDIGLLDAMRRGDERAIDEFLIRHQRLLHDRARRWRLALEDVDGCIAEVLEDVAVLIVNGRIRPTRSLAGYVTRTFRTRLALHARREADRREVVYGEGEGDDGSGAGSRERAGVVSEGTVRAARGADWEQAPGGRAVLRLAELLDGDLSDDERRILHWLGNYVPQREISDWLGVSYAAGTQRIWRLRERLRAAARGHAARFPPSEHRELERFFRRMHDPGETGTTRRPRRGPAAQGGGGGTP